MSQRGSPMPRVSGKEVGRRQDEEDDYWRSDELAADEPQAKPTDKAVGPRMARSSSSDIIDLSVDHHALPPSSIPAIPSSGLPLALPPSSPSSKPPQHASELSERQLTPVPGDVREIHRRLCRQQPGRRRGRSPWRKPGDPEPEPPSAKKRKKLDATEQVTRRALEKAQVKGRKAGALVNLSDEETTPRKKAMPLSPIPPNILGAGQGSPRSRKVCKNPLLPLARLDKQTFTRSARESPFSPVRLEGGMAEGVKLAKANITPRPNRFADRFAGDDMIHVVPSAQHPPLRGPSPFALEPRPPTPSSPSSARSYSSSLPTSTPVKRTTPHHKITPPNFVTPIKSSHWQEHMETLFSFPPPPQPYFVRDEAEAGSRKAFVPTEMQSETLMTWSLGPADPGTRAPQRAFLSRDRDRIKGDQADHETLPPARPSIHPVSKRKRPQSPKPSLSPSKDGDTQSVSPKPRCCPSQL